jgi:hypothetical protein
MTARSVLASLGGLLLSVLSSALAGLAVGLVVSGLLWAVGR